MSFSLKEEINLQKVYQKVNDFESVTLTLGPFFSIFIEFFEKLAPDLVAVVAFGQILPPKIVFRPPLGCINVHPSLLPGYRGAAPMNWTLIQGETRTGLTIMLMDEGMDSGDILLQKEAPIEPEDNYDTLHDRLADMGAKMLLDVIKGRLDNTITRIPQDHALATFAPRLKKEDGLIRWNHEVRSIANLIRGLSSAPGAYTLLEGKVLKIYKTDFKDTLITRTDQHLFVKLRALRQISGLFKILNRKKIGPTFSAC